MNNDNIITKDRQDPSRPGNIVKSIVSDSDMEKIQQKYAGYPYKVNRILVARSLLLAVTQAPHLLLPPMVSVLVELGLMDKTGSLTDRGKLYLYNSYVMSDVAPNVESDCYFEK